MFSAETTVPLTEDEQAAFTAEYGDNPTEEQKAERNAGKEKEKKIQGWEVMVPIVKMVSSAFSLLFIILCAPTAFAAGKAAAKEIAAAAAIKATQARAAAKRAGAAAGKMKGSGMAGMAGMAGKFKRP